VSPPSIAATALPANKLRRARCSSGVTQSGSRSQQRQLLSPLPQVHSAFRPSLIARSIKDSPGAFAARSASAPPPHLLPSRRLMQPTPRMLRTVFASESAGPPTRRRAYLCHLVFGNLYQWPGGFQLLPIHTIEGRSVPQSNTAALTRARRALARQRDDRCLGRLEPAGATGRDSHVLGLDRFRGTVPNRCGRRLRVSTNFQALWAARIPLAMSDHRPVRYHLAGGPHCRHNRMSTQAYT